MIIPPVGGSAEVLKHTKMMLGAVAKMHGGSISISGDEMVSIDPDKVIVEIMSDPYALIIKVED